MTAQEIADRNAGIDRLCRILGAGRAYICDAFLWFTLGEPSLNPEQLEHWLEKHGKGPKEGESLRDAIEKHYGKETADLAESLI